MMGDDIDGWIVPHLECGRIGRCHGSIAASSPHIHREEAMIDEPKVVALLDKVACLEETREHLMEEVNKLMGECQEMFRKYDDAREAVFILDGAMEEMESVSPNYVDGTPMNRPKMREVLTHLSWKATSARTDPVVRRIVEGG